MYGELFIEFRTTHPPNSVITKHVKCKIWAQIVIYQGINYHHHPKIGCIINFVTVWLRQKKSFRRRKNRAQKLLQNFSLHRSATYLLETDEGEAKSVVENYKDCNLIMIGWVM